MKTLIRDTVSIIVIAAVIIFGLQITAQKFVIYGPSMYSTFQDGQQLMVNKLAYNFGEPERGDVVVFLPPIDDEEEYIKRIIGLPGEFIEMKNGTVYIHQADGTVFPLDEPYVSKPYKSTYESDIIPEGNYFMLGDNRNNSSDSRTGWTLPLDNIIGKAWLSVWPPDKWGLVVNAVSAK